jgi:tetratricopeptide (TPR) repeat protein
LDVLAALPDGPLRRQQELDLRIALIRALSGTKGYAARDVGEAIARARTLAEQINRPEYLVPLIIGQWTYHLTRAEHKVALSFAERIEEIGEARNDVAVRLQGRLANGLTRLYLGEFVAARALLEQCHGLTAHRGVGGRGGVRVDSYAVMLGCLAVTLACLGYIDQARSRLKEALLEARRLRHAHTLAEVLANAYRVEAMIRSPEMQRYAEELLALSTEHDLASLLGLATVSCGLSLTARGQAQKGLTLITQGLAAIRATEAVAGTPNVLMGFAATYAMIGEPVEGLNCLDEAAQIIETTEERVGESELDRVRGDLLNAKGDRSGAEQNYHQALAIAKRQSTKLFELRAATSLARLCRDQGKRTEARDLLAPVYGWFTEGFDTPVLKDAKALLDELA